VAGTDNIPDFIRGSGFEVVNKLKILGFEITKNYNDLVQNIHKATDKIKNIIRFWTRFRLSLIGRINVAKTLLISQLNYYVSVIPVNNMIIDEISTIINNFIKGKLKIGKELFSLDVNKGGIGFFDLKNFIFSLQSSWVKRAHNNSIDNWRLTINRATEGNVELLAPELFDTNSNPLLHNIVTSFFEFKHEFYLLNDNFLHSRLLGNPILRIKENTIRNRGENVPLGPDPEQLTTNNNHVKFDFWETNGTINIPVLSQICIGDLLNNAGTLRSDQDLQEILNLPVEKIEDLKKSY
jgi:hypothetical protein